VGDCFIYNNAAWRLNYCVGGEVTTLFHLDKPLYLLGYLAAQSRVYLIDRWVALLVWNTTYGWANQWPACTWPLELLAGGCLLYCQQCISIDVSNKFQDINRGLGYGEVGHSSLAVCGSTL
jgi:hypothetical protein